jgi:hypothetical protein
MQQMSVTLTSFRKYCIAKLWGRNGGIFPSHRDGYLKQFELGRISVFDVRLAIEVKFD